MDLGPSEILIVLAIALVLLGPSRLPSLARSLGEAIHELRRSAHGDEAVDGDLTGGIATPAVDRPSGDHLGAAGRDAATG